MIVFFKKLFRKIFPKKEESSVNVYVSHMKKQAKIQEERTESFHFDPKEAAQIRLQTLLSSPPHQSGNVLEDDDLLFIKKES